MYSIELTYTTGNTFGSDEVQRILDYEWDTEEKAINEMNKIRDHWIYNKKLSSTHKQDEKKLLKTKAFMKEWFKPGESDYILILKDNDGNNIELYANWLGYFETLHSTKVINTNQKETYIDFDNLRMNMDLW